MSETGKITRHAIDRAKLGTDFPTQYQEPMFWEELGRTVATFGLLEEQIAKAIFVLTGADAFDREVNPEAYDRWIKTLEKTLADELGRLIITYEKSLKDNPRTKEQDFSDLFADLNEAREIRNVLCHASWGKPDNQGRTVPKFVRRSLHIFTMPIDVNFLNQTRKALGEIICEIIDSVLMAGYNFPGLDSPGEQFWASPTAVNAD